MDYGPIKAGFKSSYTGKKWRKCEAFIGSIIGDSQLGIIICLRERDSVYDLWPLLGSDDTASEVQETPNPPQSVGSLPGFTSDDVEQWSDGIFDHAILERFRTEFYYSTGKEVGISQKSIFECVGRGRYKNQRNIEFELCYDMPEFCNKISFY